MFGLISQFYRESLTSREAIVRMYDFEYAERHYGYLNLLQCKGGLEHILGAARVGHLVRNKILDVGAGSNELLRYLNHCRGVPKNNLHGCDISAESCKIVREDGYKAFVGRLEEVCLSRDSFDLIFLSYFIDYDTNQQATFDAAVRAIRCGGCIVLEGLLPSRPSGLLQTDRANHHFVTRGISTKEDIRLITESIRRAGVKERKAMKEVVVVRSERYLFNRLGLRKLPSTFIRFCF